MNRARSPRFILRNASFALRLSHLSEAQSFFGGAVVVGDVYPL